jgi:beta-glucosidase
MTAKMGRFPFILSLGLFLAAGSAALLGQTYLDSTATVEARVEDLVSRMTLDEKIGQMTQAERGAVSFNPAVITALGLGSILSGGGSAPFDNSPRGWADMVDGFQSRAMQTRLRIPLLYGVDAVHGHNNAYGAVIFPHNVGMGCTRNPELVEKEERVTAAEMKATGVHWTFGPCIAVPRDERWGRTYEGFGETAELAVMMAPAAVRGFQGADLSGPGSVLACAKHYVGDGGTSGGADQGNAVMDEATLRAVHLPGYQAAVQAGVGSVMVSFSSWNGQKMHGNKYLLTDVLKQELGFQGFVVSDWLAIGQLSNDYALAVEAAVNAGIDMAMEPYSYARFISTLRDLAGQGRVSQERIDDAVRRILRVKFRMGLFERPFANRAWIDSLGAPEHREAARECVRSSLVLMKKKDGILPVSKTVRRIHVAGSNADDLGAQCGGWTMSWQGSRGEITVGTTILEAIRNAAPSAEVTYDPSGAEASGADVGVAVIGEDPYAEYSGDRANLGLSPADVLAVRNLKAAGLPVVVILVSGRPLILQPVLHYCDALIAAWLPGTEGRGVADVLFGDAGPSGRLSHSWPRSMAQIPINSGDADYDPLFPYGFGITTLEDSPGGSSPVLLSAAAVEWDGRIELTFNKPMNAPGFLDNPFEVTVNANKVPVAEIGLCPADSATLELALGAPLAGGDTVQVACAGFAGASRDGGALAPFGPVGAVRLPETRAFPVPGRIEAEGFIDMRGVETETTADEGGGLDVCKINTGDWMEYWIDVKQTDAYALSFRVSAPASGGWISISAEGTDLGRMDVPATGGAQAWATVQTSASLAEGARLVRIKAGSGGFNLNWFAASQESGIRDAETSAPGTFGLLQNYPNPFNPSTVIPYRLSRAGKAELKIFDTAGREVASNVSIQQSPGYHEFIWNPLGLSSGIYLVRLRVDGSESFRKMVLER